MTRRAALGRVAIQQRVLPSYRAPFFDALAAHCAGGLHVFAGSPRPGESIHSATRLNQAAWDRVENLHLLGGAAYLCYQRGLLEGLKRFDPETLIVEANWRYLATPRVVDWMKDRGRPVIGWGLGASGGAAGLFRRRLLRRLDAVIAYSTRGAAEYAAAGVPVERIYVAPNAVDPPAGRPPRRPTGISRRSRVLFVGRLQRRKRVDDLLRACAALSPPPELWIVGEGPDRDRLVALASHVFPTAVFTGAVHGAALTDIFDGADLFVLPGTGGLAIQQAMARGLPVIAAEGDGSQEDMVTPQNGWLVAAGEREALTGALHDALRDPRRLAKMGAASYHLTRDRFNPQAMVAVFLRALRDVRRS